MNYIIIVLGIIVLILVYILYKYFTTSASTLSAKTNLNSTTPLSIPITDSPQSVRYAYGLWISVNTWKAGAKNIFARKVSANNQISLDLGAASPTLTCTLGQTCAGGSTATDAMTLTNNFPIQKWTYIVVSVDGQMVDLYLDGLLIKSVQLNCPAEQPDATEPVTLGIGYDAQVAGFQRWATPLNPQDVWSNYIKGNGSSITSMFSSYGVNVGLTKNSVQQNTFTLF